MDSIENVQPEAVTEVTQTEVTTAPVAEAQETQQEDVWTGDFNPDGPEPSEAPTDANAQVEGTEADVEQPGSDMDTLYRSQIDASTKLDKPVLIKVRGKVVEVTDVNEMRDLMERGIGASKKYQEMAEGRKYLQYLEDNNINQQTIEAIIASRGDVPVVENESNTELDTIANEIMNSGYVDKFQNAVSNLPESVRESLSTDPSMLKGFASDIESGLVSPDVVSRIDRYMEVNNMDFRSSYIKAIQETQTTTPTTAADEVRTTLSSQPKNNVASQDPTKSVWDMPLKDFDRYFDRM